MGTSSSFDGLTNGSPLLPPWAQDEVIENPDDNEEQDEIPESLSGSWQSAKSLMTRYVNSSGDTEKLKQSARSYVQARGGATGASRAAISGKNAASNLGNFFSGVINQGIERTLESYGLHHIIGDSVENVFMAIAESLSPKGDSIENSIARQATIDTLAFVYDKYEFEDYNIEKFNSMKEDDIREVLELCIESYIYERWLQELGIRIEKNAISEKQAIRLEMDVKDLVKSSISFDFQDYDLLNINFKDGAGKSIIDNIYKQAYTQLEVIE